MLLNANVNYTERGCEKRLKNAQRWLRVAGSALAVVATQRLDRRQKRVFFDDTYIKKCFYRQCPAVSLSSSLRKNGKLCHRMLLLQIRGKLSKLAAGYPVLLTKYKNMWN